ncbi:MAG TPA: hypothetical protein VGR55_08465, partial [Candidatus Acidoferrum sp.]|nr:hypothetical protein [Candidatus Acidoferrum sp.]
MIQKKAIILLVALTLVIGVIAGYSLLPKRYLVGQSLTQTTVFWNGKEAFFFLNTNTIGRSSNFLSDKLGKTNYGYLALLLGARSQFYEYGVTAYRLEPSGELQRLPLPDDSTTLGRWSLEAGQLQLTPVASGNSHFIGFKWDGAKFVAVQPQKEPHTEAGGNTTLSPDDL